ncbi:MAG TPA: hypothetical protein VHT73_12815 [Thermodesulfobacteriota bacterium]|nr:hypothetical protein [Thermodesulfobacteriota bacterium]
MNEEIVYADKNLRRRTVLLMLMFILILAPIALLTLNYLKDLEALAKNNSKEALSRVITLTYIWGAFFATGNIAIFGYLMWLGIRIIKGDRYPPPGMGVIKDTKVVRGTKARFRGGFLIFAAVVILLVGSTTIVITAKLISSATREISKDSKMSRSNTNLTIWRLDAQRLSNGNIPKKIKPDLV